jgi:hypothetical protein
VALIRRRTRAIYHRAIRIAKKQRDQIIAEKMGAAFLAKDSTSFWKNVNKFKCKGQSSPSTIDSATGSEGISELFANKFRTILNSVSYNDDDMSMVINDINVQINDRCSTGKCHFSHCIDHSTISIAIKHLKKGKVDGDACLYTDHFVNGTHKLNVLLALAINAMFSHGYCPAKLLSATIIPIPKNKRNSLYDSENYRGIALSNILSKIIDSVIIDTQYDFLKTSDLQFGFKKNSSTSMCTFVMEEVVNYYVQNKSNVYAVFLDASKAFDRVNFIKLFYRLLEKGICPLVARFLAFVYTNQVCRTKWADALSNNFFISNGVKQGGVLSPFLFNVYIDVLLQRLKLQGFGCHIGNTFIGALSYADDIVLLAPTLTSLKKQLHTCEQFSEEFHINFNCNKSKLLCFGERVNVKLPFQGNIVPQVDNYKHLGNLVGSNSIISNKTQIQLAINELYGKMNVLHNQFKFADEDVMYSLFKTHCLSLYGCQLWDLSSSVMEKFAIAWRKCVRRLYNIPLQSHCDLLPYICKDTPITVQLHSRFLKFFVSLWYSSNAIVSTCSKVCMHKSQSRVSASLNHVCSKYKLCKYNPELFINCKLYNVDYENVSFLNANTIREFIHFRHHTVKAEDKDNANCIISYLCTE